MKLVGITGLIGSGKTTVGNILRNEGYIVYDFDVWCRKMYEDEQFLSIIKENFPSVFEKNIINKKKLRNLVFNDNDKLKKLEELTHPFLINKLKKIIHKKRFKNQLFFIECALLYQMNIDKYCAYIIQTQAPLKVMEERVLKRDNISIQEYQKIFKKQTKNKNTTKNPDFIIDTNKSLNIIKADIKKILQKVENC